MKNLIAAQVLAAASLVALPLAASANSVSQEKAYDRIHQSLNTQARSTTHEADKFAIGVDLYDDGSPAMNEARQNIQEETNHTTQLDTEDSSNRFSFKVDLNGGGSHAMNEVRKRL